MRTIVTSTSLRAISSAKALGKLPSITDSLFCEAGLPYADWKLLRLKPKVWAGVFRVLWYLGYANQCESLGAARARTKTAARRLAHLAHSGPVLLAGHGIMNRLIAKELLTIGWSGPSSPPSAYWGYCVYLLMAIDKCKNAEILPAMANTAVHPK